MKRLSFIYILCLIAAVSACTKGGKPTGVTGTVYSVTAAASSKQLVPAIDTTSTATFTGLYDEQANILTYTIAWNDLWRDTQKDTITSISFYGPATATTNGPLVRMLPFINTNRIGSINLGLSGNTGLTEEEKSAFMSGNWYFTINTKRYSTGIVRGQLTLAEQ
jgi:hypothetical protein